MGEGLITYKPPIEENELGEDDKNALKVRYLTPHGKWQIHSTFMDNLRMLELFRGGPVIWLNEEEAKSVGIKDNDWVILKNENGITVVRAVLSHRVPKGVGIMYHAQERTVNVGEYNGFAGGSHNAVTRVNVKPTHMIGGYAQLSYSLNYYGPIGTNRDTMILVKRVSVK
jgi:nitrate reductase alpha subunit